MIDYDFQILIKGTDEYASPTVTENRVYKIQMETDDMETYLTVQKLIRELGGRPEIDEEYYEYMEEKDEDRCGKTQNYDR